MLPPYVGVFTTQQHGNEKQPFQSLNFKTDIFALQRYTFLFLLQELPTLKKLSILNSCQPKLQEIYSFPQDIHRKRCIFAALKKLYVQFCLFIFFYYF
jgi:hypothetical protein